MVASPHLASYSRQKMAAPVDTAVTSAEKLRPRRGNFSATSSKRRSLRGAMARPMTMGLPVFTASCQARRGGRRAEIHDHIAVSMLRHRVARVNGEPEADSSLGCRPGHGLAHAGAREHR